MGDATKTALPEPEFDGLTWRPPRREDAVAIAALHDACFASDNDYRVVESEVLERWEWPGMIPDTDALIGVDDSNEIVVSIWTIASDTAETKWRSFGFDNRIHPDHRNNAMREFVLAWWEARSLQRLEGKNDGLPVVLGHFLYSHLTVDIDFLLAHGCEITRYYDELGCDLARPLVEAPIPEGIDVRPLDANRPDGLMVHNASFSDHWGSQPLSEERWSAGFNEWHLPEASFVAYDGTEPVAYVSCEAFPHEFEDRGWRHAWIGGVGTLRSHRKRGIASALIVRAMQVMAASGMEYALLGVDSENPTGAYGVYEDLGFAKLRSEVLVSRTV